MTSRTSIAWGSPPTTRTIGKQAKGQLFLYITSKGPVQPKETKAILNNVHPQHLYVRTTNVCPCPCRARTLRMTIAPGCRMVNHALPWARFPLGFQPVSSSSSQTYPFEHEKEPQVRNELKALGKWRRPTLPRVCSTIGATVLNFSVRNGKRWNHSAITTGNILLDIVRNTSSVLLFLVSS